MCSSFSRTRRIWHYGLSKAMTKQTPPVIMRKSGVLDSGIF